MDNKRLIAILSKSTAVDPVALNSVAMEAERWGNDIVRGLLDKHAITEEALMPLLSQYWGVPGVDLSTFRPSHDLIERLAIEIADEHRAIPLRVDGAFIDVAFDHPSEKAIDAIRVHTKLNVRAHVTSPKSIDRLLALHYGRMNIGGYQVDPRVTSGNFLSSDVLDFEQGEASVSIPVDISSFDDSPSMRTAAGTGHAAQEAQLLLVKQSLDRAEQRIQLLEAHVARDQDVLRRLFGYLVDKGVGSREEIVELLS
jgi:hypothetical protein